MEASHMWPCEHQRLVPKRRPQDSESSVLAASPTQHLIGPWFNKHYTKSPSFHLSASIH